MLPDDQHRSLSFHLDIDRKRKVLTTVTESLYEIGDQFILDIKARTVTLLSQDIMADIKGKHDGVMTAAYESELMAAIQRELNARITMEEVIRMLTDAPRRH